MRKSPRKAAVVARHDGAAGLVMFFGIVIAVYLAFAM